PHNCRQTPSPGRTAPRPPGSPGRRAAPAPLPAPSGTPRTAARRRRRSWPQRPAAAPGMLAVLPARPRFRSARTKSVRRGTPPAERSFPRPGSCGHPLDTAGRPPGQLHLIDALHPLGKPLGGELLRTLCGPP
ncbi:DUF5655 domain-containing protein, partial [Dysosmobacter welbionis]